MKDRIVYPESSVLIGAAKSVWEGSSALIKIEITPMARLVEEMRVYGISPLETVFITDSDMRHIRRGHANDLERRGQPNITPEDFGLLPLVLAEFDTCEHTDTDKLGNRKFLLSKRIDDTFYVVTIQRGKRKLEVKTMWKRPGASC